ncbi:DUF4870 domain-containing protein [bacterium]|nr:DUF4870 domain-containing protein [bacterium]
MKRLVPAFKDDNDRMILVLMMVCSLFLLILSPIIVIFGLKDKVSDGTMEISKAFFNFELMMLLISLLFMVPIIGWLLAVILAPLMVILNVIVVVINLCAVAKGGELKVPVWYEFI